ncbi:MAG: 16S rRNA (cytidine(1402)-2'-O)-methyltransferase [Saprospiraceae bacterium]|nr:16S rRNA (cytidine(1402)-2'-O)-methyltransferase [Saprospiraceae bacterium]
MLYIVPTPIGNLEDITLRAVEVLRTVDYILAEDTRTTRKLLDHLGIANALTAYHAHNEHKLTPRVVYELQEGAEVALVSDAGTPGISDPAYLLVRACQEAGVTVTCLPGPTAVVPAIVLSGFPMDRFHFEGFLPHKKGRATRWKALSGLDSTLVLYESPHRIVKCLSEAQTHLGPERPVAVVREISKLHEEVHRGSVTEVLKFFQDTPAKAKGEVVVIFGRPV